MYKEIKMAANFSYQATPKNYWIGNKSLEVDFVVPLTREIILVLVSIIVFESIRRRGQSLKRKKSLPVVRHFPIIRLPQILEGCYTLVKIRLEGLAAFVNWEQKYGPVFKLPFYYSSVVCLNDPDMIHKALHSTEPGHLNKPPFIYDYIFVENLKQGLVSSDYETWSSRRKMTNRAFTYKALRTYMGFMNEHAKSLNASLLKGSKPNSSGKMCIEGNEMFDLVYFHSLKIIMHILMGADTSCSDEDSIFFHNHFRRAKEIVVHRFLHSELLLDFVWALHPMKREFKRIFKSLKEFVNMRTEKYRQKIELEREQDLAPKSSENEDDLDDHPSSMEEDDVIGLKPFRCLIEEMLRSDATNNEIFNEVSTFISAGHETVTVSIHYIMWHLACNPEHQELCRSEVDTILNAKQVKSPEDAVLDMEDVHNLKHLERCILEGLRLTPSIPIFARRLDTPLKIDEEVFEPGTNLMFTPWVIHRNPEYFPEPEKFKPDRFLPENVKNRVLTSYFPFSAGPRNCIGWKLTMVQMKVIVGCILRNFELYTTDNPENMKWMFEITLKPEPMLDLKLIQREL